MPGPLPPCLFSLWFQLTTEACLLRPQHSVVRPAGRTSGVFQEGSTGGNVGPLEKRSRFCILQLAGCEIFDLPTSQRPSTFFTNSCLLHKKNTFVVSAPVRSHGRNTSSAMNGRTPTKNLSIASTVPRLLLEEISCSGTAEPSTTFVSFRGHISRKNVRTMARNLPKNRQLRAQHRLPQPRRVWWRLQ